MSPTRALRRQDEGRDHGQVVNPHLRSGVVFVAVLALLIPACSEADSIRRTGQVGLGCCVEDSRHVRTDATATSPKATELMMVTGHVVVPIDVSEIQAADGGLTCMSILS